MVNVGDIIELNDKQSITLPNYVTKIRLEVHGGRGGSGGSGLRSGYSGKDGYKKSGILELNKVLSPRTITGVKGYNGGVGGRGSNGEGRGGSGGGGGSSAVLINNTLVIQAKGGDGGSGGAGLSSAGSGKVGSGGSGYVNGSGSGGGGSNYLMEGLITTETKSYRSGLLEIEILEVDINLIKSDNKYYTYSDYKLAEVEPTKENFIENSINLTDITIPINKLYFPMDSVEELSDGKLYRKQIDLSNLPDNLPEIERIEVM